MAWGVGCRRTGLGYLSATGDTWVKKDGKPIRFETEAEAQAEAARLRGVGRYSVHYWAEELPEARS